MSIFEPLSLHTIETFVRGVAVTRTVWMVVGEEGVARVASATRPGRMTHLLWSERVEAARWADVLVRGPRLEAVHVADFIAHVLPWFAGDERLVGTDWSAEPIEPEIEAGELGRLLRQQLVAAFARAVVANRTVWVLDGPGGMAIYPEGRSMASVLPAWADRSEAERCIAGVWSGMRPLRLSLGDFNHRVLLACAGSRARVAPAFVEGSGAIDMTPWDVKALLGGVEASERRVA